MLITPEKLLEKLPPEHRNFENLYGKEYWLIPAIVWWLRPRVIVELGTDKLTSATMIAGTMPKSSTFFTVDIRPECRLTVEASGLRVIPITGDSAEIGRKWEIPFELLFVDARHEYDSVTDELNVWASKVTKCIMLHDIISCGDRVAPAIKDWLAKGNNEEWEYQPYEHDCGMGVLWRKGWWNQ